MCITISEVFLYMINQVKSKDRISKHGEVFTNEKEVNAMLDLVKNETDRIESRFLEPACGNGNFLVEIINRKMKRVERQFKRNFIEYEKNAFLALTSVYGIDILEDNVRECRRRLFEIWNEKYIAVCKKNLSVEVEEAVKFILHKNVLCGNALTLLDSSNNPIVFSQWDFIIGTKIKRRDYTLDALVNATIPDIDENTGMTSLADFSGDNNKWEYTDNRMQQWKYDAETHGWVPSPIREFPLVDYWEVQNVDEK